MHASPEKKVGENSKVILFGQFISHFPVYSSIFFVCSQHLQQLAESTPIRRVKAQKQTESTPVRRVKAEEQLSRNASDSYATESEVCAKFFFFVNGKFEIFGKKRSCL